MKYIIFIILISSFSLFANTNSKKTKKSYEKILFDKYKEQINKNKQLIIVVKHKYKLFFYENKKLKKVYEVGLSQSPIGDKKLRGDNKVPEGEYHIIQKAVGPFPGKYGAYLGRRWMRVSYPNIKDAKSGLKRKVITKKQYNQIVTATKKKKMSLKNTALGGGIGIHGWADYGWRNDENRDLTWGCIVMHNYDIEEFYREIKLFIKILIVK